MTEQEAEIKRVISHIRSCRETGIDTTITLDKDKSHFILNALEEVRQYRALEDRLKKVYGDCSGLLETAVQHLEAHEGVDLPEPIFKARLLTDAEVDKWAAYKALGTVKECQEAAKKQKMKRPLYDRPIGVLACPCCGNYLQKVVDDGGSTDGSIPSYCSRCGQRISPYWTMDE